MLLLDGVEMLDVQEASRLVRRTPETVRRWVWSGRLPARRQANKLFVARSDLEQLAQGRAAGSPMTIQEWIAGAERLRADGALPVGKAGATAADLVHEDRRARESS